MIGINVVIQSVSIRSTSDEATSSDSNLCVTLGSLQPLLVAVKKESGCFALCSDQSAKELLTQGDGAMVPLKVIMLGNSSSQNVISVGTVNETLFQQSTESSQHRLYAPQPCLQLPTLLLSTSIVTVPLLRATGVATHYGTITIRVAVFDMSKRSIDSLGVFPTGRIAQLRKDREEKSLRLARDLPTSIVKRSEVGAEYENIDYADCDEDDDAEDSATAGIVDSEGKVVDSLISSLDGILKAHKSTDSLCLSAILGQRRNAPSSKGDLVSDSTLSLDDILAEMAAEEAKRREIVNESVDRIAQDKHQKPSRCDELQAQREHKRVQPTTAVPKPKRVSIQPPLGKLVSAAAQKNSKRVVKKMARNGAKSEADTSKNNLSRVLVLVKKEELAGLALDGPNTISVPTPVSVPSSPSRRRPQSVPPEFYDQLACATPLDISMIDHATVAKVRERQIRMSNSIPVRPPAAPMLVYNNHGTIQRAEDKSAPKPKAKKVGPSKRSGGPAYKQRETLLNVTMGKLS